MKSLAVVVATVSLLVKNFLKLISFDTNVAPMSYKRLVVAAGQDRAVKACLLQTEAEGDVGLAVAAASPTDYQRLFALNCHTDQRSDPL